MTEGEKYEMRGLYTLIGKLPVPCNDVIEWGKWMATHERHVAETLVGPLRVSTVFLGCDHSFVGGDAILFETMIFGAKENGYQERYRTWDEAEQGHTRAVEIANDLMGGDITGAE